MQLKKEIVAISLLAVILACSIINVFIIKRYTQHMARLIDDTQSYAEGEHWEKAVKSAEDAVEYWQMKSRYTHIVLRHSEINATTNAFCLFLAEVYKRDVNGMRGVSKALKSQIQSIYEMEKLKLGSIFSRFFYRSAIC
jgi:hypothetical protein